MPDPTIAVRCHALTKRYGVGEGSVAALRGVNLEVKTGELLVLVGPSGCGKSTLLAIVGAILEPDAGDCEVLGRSVGSMDTPERTRFRGRSIGFVFQSFNLLPALSVLDNVCVPLLLNGAPYERAGRQARTVLEMLGLASKLRAFPGQLSGGQQQRAAIARALVHDPPLVICDEPTSNLDARAGHETMLLLRDAARASTRTLIVVTHDRRILEFADRIAWMEDGEIVANDRARLGGTA